MTSGDKIVRKPISVCFKLFSLKVISVNNPIHLSGDKVCKGLSAKDVHPARCRTLSAVGVVINAVKT